MESALTGVDVYVFERLSAGDLNSTSANASNNVRAACKNVSHCVEEAASCFTHPRHPNHDSDDCPNGVTPM